MEVYHSKGPRNAITTVVDNPIHCLKSSVSTKKALAFVVIPGALPENKNRNTTTTYFFIRLYHSQIYIYTLTTYILYEHVVVFTYVCTVPVHVHVYTLSSTWSDIPVR
jgi:hypothetical protein